MKGRLPLLRAPGNRGMALLLVLGSLIFLSVLILAFLNSAQTNLKSAKVYANGSSVRTLADSTVSLVEAQIQQATTGGSKVAWASQPGMIRTYDDAGAPKTNYKLYSWDTFSTAGAFDPEADSEAVSSSWFQSPALFVDLNKPVVNADGTTHYPILSGNNLKAYTTPSGAPAVTYMTRKAGTPDVEGFWVETGKQGAPVAPSSLLGAPSNPVPMPVKWLYVLENGTVVAPHAGGAGSKVEVPGAAKSPIVGRIAYWTDDDTSKVNVNTASEGVYWDTPRTAGNFEWGPLALNQPAQNEFQRYPGHPATTCLSTVLGPMSALTPDHATDTPNAAAFQPYYDLNPKLNVNQAGNLGSQSGTVFYGNGTGAPLTLKSDRLYATVDEFLFQSSLPPNPAFSGTRAVNNALLTNSALERADFFLTARSCAPDVNLFNKPRIGIWPVHVTNTPAYRTILDQVIAFCGTINKNLYFFQRQKNDDPTNDLPAAGSPTGLGRNRMLLSYLQDLTNRNIPGFGGTFAAKYPASGNVSERDQILTEIFDYIRSQNLNDKSSTAMVNPFAAPIANAPVRAPKAGFGTVVPIQDTVTNTRGFGRFPTVSEVALLFVATGWNDGAGGTRAADINTAGNVKTDGTAQVGYNAAIPAKHIRMQALLLINLFDPSQGFPNEYGSYHFQVSGLDSFSITPSGEPKVSLGFPAFAKAITDYPGAGTNTVGGFLGYDIFLCGGNLGFRSTILGRSLSQTPGSGVYPLVGLSVDVPYAPASAKSTVNPPSVQFWGGDFSIQVKMPNGTTVQTLNLHFPDNASCPVPVYWGGTDANSPAHAWASLSGRLNSSIDAWSVGTVFFNSSADVVRSVRAWPGDIRIIAGRTVVNAATTGNGLFDRDSTNFPEYSDSSKPFVHGLVESTSMPFYGAVWGQLVSGANYMAAMQNSRQFSANNNGLNLMFSAGMNPPTATSGTAPTTVGVYIGNTDGSGTPTALPGDWDNGISFFPDGPYINKADEGDVTTKGGSSGSVPYFSLPWAGYTAVGQTFFSPNRLMPSPGMFGSLSTGVVRNIPWMTLLFAPNPAAGDAHPGFGTPLGGNAGPLAQPPYQLPPDHLFLDLFTMPVIEPYPISEPLSTLGRVNLNYQIVPFTYIERSTGLRAVLKAERITAIPDVSAAGYKGSGYATSISRVTTYDYRLPLNLDETLKGFDDFFARTKDLFRSASQICQMFLYPARDAVLTSTSGPQWDAANANIEKFWSTHRLTGDNSRERPYTTIYPRVTTKSNTYTVHLYVQTLKKAAGGTADVWDENRDLVTGEYRGSTTVERYVDTTDATLPDFANPAGDPVLDSYYKFRIVGSRQFSR